MFLVTVLFISRLLVVYIFGGSGSYTQIFDCIEAGVSTPNPYVVQRSTVIQQGGGNK